MYTIYDYLTHVKGIEYLLALLFMAGYILYAELLKPKPFKTLKETAKEDLDFMKGIGPRNILRTLGRVVAAPFIGLAYVFVLPFVFMFTLGTTVLHNVLSVARRSIAFGWRPLEAYLTGRKKAEEKKRGQ